MKKTLTINLGGTVFHIDEDAYRLLDNYLVNLRLHFRREEGAEEIVRDMEQRISELFADRLNNDRQVITIEDVEEVIARMGKPEEFSDAEAGEETRRSETTGSNRVRRLFRDPDDRVLGGVMSGLSAYIGCNVVVLRLIALLLGCFVHAFIVVYIVAWIIIPLANTAAEKLAMRGEPINVENIGRTVTDGFERVNDYVRSDHSRSILQKVGEGIVAVAGFLIKFLLVLIGICCAPVLLVLLVVLLALFMVATGLIAAVPAVLYEVLPSVDWSLVNLHPWSMALLSISGILVIGIPIVGLIHLLMRCFGGWQPMSTVTKVIFILLWLVALGVCIFFLLNSAFIASHLNF
ncbi:MAG: PspC domain-containing protein [Bacteroidales bacterium]|nr:PspC domain-containing protein [Bacteroidales bacterium]